MAKKMTDNEKRILKEMNLHTITITDDSGKYLAVCNIINPEQKVYVHYIAIFENKANEQLPKEVVGELVLKVEQKFENSGIKLEMF